MAAAGVATVDLRREPVDSVFHELEFLAYLHACIGEALRVGNGDAEREWRDRLCSFANDHALKWLPAFMQKVAVFSHLEEYRAFARLGARYLGELATETGADIGIVSPASCKG